MSAGRQTTTPVIINLCCGTTEVLVATELGVLLRLGYIGHMVIPRPGLRWRSSLASCIINLSLKNRSKVLFVQFSLPLLLCGCASRASALQESCSSAVYCIRATINTFILIRYDATALFKVVKRSRKIARFS